MSAPLTSTRRQNVNSNYVVNGNREMVLLTLSMHGHHFLRLTTEWYCSTSLLPCIMVQQGITPKNTRSSAPENMAGKRGRERYGAKKDIGSPCLLQSRHRSCEIRMSIHIRCPVARTITKRTLALLSLMYMGFHPQSVRCWYQERVPWSCLGASLHGMLRRLSPAQYWTASVAKPSFARGGPGAACMRACAACHPLQVYTCLRRFRYSARYLRLLLLSE